MGRKQTCGPQGEKGRVGDIGRVALTHRDDHVLNSQWEAAE